MPDFARQVVKLWWPVYPILSGYDGSGVRKSHRKRLEPVVSMEIHSLRLGVFQDLCLKKNEGTLERSIPEHPQLKNLPHGSLSTHFW